MVQSPSWEANWFAASQEIPRISHYLRNGKIWGEKFYENEMWELIFYTNVSKTFLILRSI